MKKYFSLITILLFLINCKSQNLNPTLQIDSKYESSKPKLVVGIVVDQMRYDYLSRFYSKFGEGGFKKLISKGYNVKNAHFNFSATKTAVGHSSIHTGTTPVNHGILSNDWYDKSSKTYINCVGDDRYKTVGTSSDNGQRSPSRLQTTTISDQLHLAQNMNGKVIGMSSKDRGAILPVGHTANAAYWYDGGDHGKFISSTYYLEKLPKWVLDFNNSGKAENYISKPWDTYYNISTYTESIEDNNPYEQVLNGEKTPTFPHNIPELREKNDNYSIITETPFGNSLLTDLAIASINGEQLGKSSFTDFLSISYSSTDYIGHGFGVVSKEIQDAYIRLDKDLERLLNFLDSDVGKENYTLFLTADHGATHVPQYLIDNSIPANYFDGNKFKEYVKMVAMEKFGTKKLIENISNNTIYFDKTELNKLKIDQGIIQQIIADEIINYDGIYKTVTARTLQTTNFTEGILSLIQNSYNQKLSGDVLYAYELSTISNWYENKGGTTHGSGYNYNTHVPLLFYGKGIKNGASNSYYHIIDIAPTISTLLGIEFPNGNTGKAIEEVLK